MAELNSDFSPIHRRRLRAFGIVACSDLPRRAAGQAIGFRFGGVTCRLTFPLSFAGGSVSKDDVAALSVISCSGVLGGDNLRGFAA